MLDQPNSRTFSFLLLLAGAVFSITNVLMLVVTVKGSLTVPLVLELYRVCPPCVAYFVVAPLVVAVLHVLVFGRIQRHSSRHAEVPPLKEPPALVSGTETTASDSAASAYVLLSLLQREGRFLDFLAEDLSRYSDDQIGAAARAIHAGCRKALDGRVELDHVLDGDEGQEVTVPNGFDPAEVRLVGTVPTSGPYRGTLQHPGWRVRKLALPAIADPAHLQILAPAEVEVSSPRSAGARG